MFGGQAGRLVWLPSHGGQGRDGRTCVKVGRSLGSPLHHWYSPLQEIFGPVLTVYPYPDEQFVQMAELADQTSPYGLTGAIYVQDPEAREKLCETFRDTAGNFYINDKSTGSIVGQQPFGGARLSGESWNKTGCLFAPKISRTATLLEGGKLALYIPEILSLKLVKKGISF